MSYNPQNRYNPKEVNPFEVPNPRQRNIGAQQVRGRTRPYQEERPAEFHLIQQLPEGGQAFISSGNRVNFLSSSITVANGVKATNIITTRARNKNHILAKTYRTIWISSRTVANWFPRGSAITQADWPYFHQSGLLFDVDDDNTISDAALKFEDLDQVTLTNNTGSSQTIIFDSFVRYIINGVSGGN